MALTDVRFTAERLTFCGVLFLVLLLGVDIVDDLRHGGDRGHIATELLAFLTAFALLGTLVRQRLSSASKERAAMVSQVAGLEAERNAWRDRASDALRGLALEIDRQLEAWGLSASEKEIAMLMLKGLSHKEIADVRATSERTVRQQAASVYQKAGLEGKHQLSAFILEDLILPSEARPRSGSDR